MKSLLGLLILGMSLWTAQALEVVMVCVPDDTRPGLEECWHADRGLAYRIRQTIIDSIALVHTLGQSPSILRKLKEYRHVQSKVMGRPR